MKKIYNSNRKIKIHHEYKYGHEMKCVFSDYMKTLHVWQVSSTNATQ